MPTPLRRRAIDRPPTPDITTEHYEEDTMDTIEMRSGAEVLTGSPAVTVRARAGTPRPRRRVPRSPTWQTAGRWTTRVGSLVVAVAVWHVLTTQQVDLFVRFSRVPPPGDVLDAFRVQVADGLYNHVRVSGQRILTGFALASMIGVAVGVAVARSRLVSDVVRPVLEVVRPIPAIAWVPLAIMMFPTSEQGIVFITFLAAFFPVMVSTLHAVRAVPPVWEQAARTIGAGRRTIWWRVLLPGILPGVFSGLSVAMGVAWICVISAEMISGQLGVGYFTWQAYGLLDYPGVVVGMLTIGLLGWASAAMIELVGRRVTAWLPSEERGR